MDAVSEKSHEIVRKANRNNTVYATNHAKKDGNPLVQFVGRAGGARVVVLALFQINAIKETRGMRVYVTNRVTRVSMVSVQFVGKTVAKYLF